MDHNKKEKNIIVIRKFRTLFVIRHTVLKREDEIKNLQKEALLLHYFNLINSESGII